MSEPRPQLEIRTSPKNVRKPQKRSLALRQAILDVAEEYDQMTVRQLFYQLVSRQVVEKTEQAYKRVAEATRDLRLGGELDYSKIADGSRLRREWRLYDSVRELLEENVEVYRRDYWRSQECRVEVWSEKDALSGIIEPICMEYGVPYVATRGFPSLTLIWETVQEVSRGAEEGKITLICYFGDHDASGVAIDGGLKGRLEQVGERGLGLYLSVERVALTPEQIAEYGLPTRPGKASDTRNAGFRKRFGTDASVELDALPPDVLRGLVRSSIEGAIENRAAWKRLERTEQEERKTLAALAKAKGKLRRSP